jgi:hypothetical protein
MTFPQNGVCKLIGEAQRNGIIGTEEAANLATSIPELKIVFPTSRN